MSVGLNREGYVLLCVFAYLLVLLFCGFWLYGRRDGRLMGGQGGFVKDSLAYFGAAPLPLVVFALPGLLQAGGRVQLLFGLSLVFGCGLLPIVYGRLRPQMEQSDASTVFDWIFRRLGREALWAALGGTLLFQVFLLAGCAALLARLFSSAMYLSYSLSVYFSALLLLLIGLLSCAPVQRRHYRLLGALLPLLLVVLALCLRLNGEESLRLSEMSGARFAVSTAFAALSGLGALGCLPLIHNLPKGYGKKRTAAFVLVQVLLWALCAGAVYVSVLYSRQENGGESALLLAAQDEFSPFLSALLLLIFAGTGFTGGTGALDNVRCAAEEGCALLFPLTERKTRVWACALLLAAATALSLPLALQQEMELYRMYCVGWAGMAGALLPLILLCFSQRPKKRLVYILAPVAGSAAALLFGLVPALFALINPVFPACLAGALCTLFFTQKEQSAPAPEKEEEASPES